MITVDCTDIESKKLELVVYVSDIDVLRFSMMIGALIVGSVTGYKFKISRCRKI